MTRRLRWRLHKGAHLLDLVEEAGEQGVLYLGLFDGRTSVVAHDQVEASAMLLRKHTRGDSRQRLTSDQ